MPSSKVLDEARGLVQKRLAELDEERKRLERALAELGGKATGRRPGRPAGATGSKNAPSVVPAAPAVVAVVPAPIRLLPWWRKTLASRPLRSPSR